MALQLTEEQRAVLEQTRRVDTVEEFKSLFAVAEPEMVKRMAEAEIEVQKPNQSIATILTELRDLFLSVHRHAALLANRRYGPERQAFFRDSIRLLDTAETWFGEGSRTGLYRPVTARELIDSSRPWRARISAVASHAFSFKPKLAKEFSDVNSTRSLDEEKKDLIALTGLVKEHEEILIEYGLTQEEIKEGERLRQASEEHELLGVMGIRSQDDAIFQRNRLLTYAILMAGEARSAGINALFENVVEKRLFEKATFRNALRRIQSRKKSKGSGEEEGFEGEADTSLEEAPEAEVSEEETVA